MTNLFFSLDKGTPVMLRPLPGSVKELKSIKLLLDERKLESAILVADRGLASYVLPRLLWELAKGIEMPEAIDGICCGQRAIEGPSPGKLLTAWAINRAIDP